ncbi:MAG: NUDIX domain-containing protein, partial [Solirubrobacterales bacterium]|nr:NUDIX domain-containing protein [Solirubrobacterales bacterium]
HEREVLLVRHTYGRRSWDLPGGTVRRRELPVDAARREMQEELGCRIEDWVDFGVLQALHAAGRRGQRISLKLTLTASSHATQRTTTTRVAAIRVA